MGMTSLDTLLTLRLTWRRNGQRLVFTNGVFDLLHIGHVEYLEQARSLGDILVVALNSDSSTRAIKGSARPLVPQQARARVLAALRCVDYVTIFAQPTASDLLAALQPEIYVKGGDYALPQRSGTAEQTIDDVRLPEAQTVRAYGGQVCLLPYREGYSTTALIERIMKMYDHEKGDSR